MLQPTKRCSGTRLVYNAARPAQFRGTRGAAGPGWLLKQKGDRIHEESIVTTPLMVTITIIIIITPMIVIFIIVIDQWRGRAKKKKEEELSKGNEATDDSSYLGVLRYQPVMDSLRQDHTYQSKKERRDGVGTTRCTVCQRDRLKVVTMQSIVPSKGRHLVFFLLNNSKEYT
jgi:hypothetical protein